MLQCPSRLTSINRGGYFTMLASVNTLTEAVMLQYPPWLTIINRGGYVTMPASVNTY